VTVTAPASAPPPQPAGDQSGEALSDQAAALLREERYEEALPIAEQAYSLLKGTGKLYEAYAAYNYAWALAGTGNCEDALPLLDESERIQGPRKEITNLRKDCTKSDDDD
jgi:tetratricopeptide (TPR) repeat protein